MPSEVLIDLKPGKGLDSGIYPGAEPTVGATWRTAKNAWFRELHIEHVPGYTQLFSFIGRPTRAIAQANVDSVGRLYYEDLGIVSYYEGAAPVVIGNIDPNGVQCLTPYGSWLFASDNINPLKLWKGAGSFITVTDAATQFTRCKIVKKLAQHVLAYCTDTFPAGFHWCSASAPEVWTPAAGNSAGNLPIRDLDSDIIAVENLGAAHAIYSENYMLIVRYTGASNWFGTPDQALIGIGAAGINAIVSLGKFNWGLSRSGIFLTDGSTYMYVDRPAVDRWLQEKVDWTRKSEIAGYYDNVLQLIVWSVPLLTGGKTAIAVDPKNKTSLVDNGKRTFTYLGDDIAFGAARLVFDYPIVARDTGMSFNSVANTVIGDFQLTSQLFDAGDASLSKQWDTIYLDGTISGEIRLGFTNTPTFESVSWGAWQDATSVVNTAGRKSIYLAIDLKSTEALKISSITVRGEKGDLEN